MLCKLGLPQALNNAEAERLILERAEHEILAPSPSPASLSTEASSVGGLGACTSAAVWDPGSKLSASYLACGSRRAKLACEPSQLTSEDFNKERYGSFNSERMQLPSSFSEYGCMAQ